MTPEWGEMAWNQAGRIEGRSVRIFAKSRETQLIAGFRRLSHSWRESGRSRHLADPRKRASSLNPKESRLLERPTQIRF